MSDPANLAHKTGESSVSSAVQWSDTTIQLKELVGRPVPNLIKVTKGQYRNIGVAKTVHSELYIHSICTTHKVLAEGVKVKDGKRLLQTDQRFSMPISYPGWFELLSEDGKAIKALQTVLELAKLFPQSCLVRDNIKAYIPKENGDLSLDTQQTIPAGELLTLAGDINLQMTNSNGKHPVRKHLLKCFNSKGESLYLGYEQKGTFSPVAGHANISGVHSVKALIEKFRFPILVRLVHGIIPTKVERSFTGIFRLTSIFTDETAFVCPLRKDAKMVPISTREPLKVAIATNFSQLKDLDETKSIHQKCTQMIGSYMNSIHVLVSMPDPSLLTANKVETSKHPQQQKRKASKSSRHQMAASAGASQEEEDILFLEIEDIYHYVREGGIVPPPRPRPTRDAKPMNADGVAKAMANVGQAAATPKPTAAVSPVSPQRLTPNRESADKLSAGDRSQGDNTSGENILWEEPIYEPLHKIKQLKRKSVQELEQTIVFDQDYLRQSKDKSPKPAGGHSPMTLAPDAPVSNLRQVIKQNQRDISPEPDPMWRGRSPEVGSSREKPSQDVVPPVPPKQFNDAGASKPAPKKLSSTPFKSMVKTSPQSPSSPPGVVNISIHNSEAAAAMHPNQPLATPITPSQLYAQQLQKRRAPLPPATPITSAPSSVPVGNSRVTNRMSQVFKPNRPSQLLPTAQQPMEPNPRQAKATRTPPYVAVARVGDGVPVTAPKANLPGRIQSMYL